MNHRKELSKSAAIMAAMFAAGIRLPESGPSESRVVAAMTEEEREWVAGLNPHRRQDWTNRFRLGLTAEQRRYVDQQLQEAAGTNATS